MSDLISREALQHKFAELVATSSGEQNVAYYDALREINWFPAVDAVEVVRCGECENWYRNNNDEYAKKYSCQIRNSYTASTDYCSYGKRRESEGV